MLRVAAGRRTRRENRVAEGEEEARLGFARGFEVELISSHTDKILGCKIVSLLGGVFSSSSAWRGNFFSS